MTTWKDTARHLACRNLRHEDVPFTRDLHRPRAAGLDSRGATRLDEDGAVTIKLISVVIVIVLIFHIAGSLSQRFVGYGMGCGGGGV